MEQPRKRADYPKNTGGLGPRLTVIGQIMIAIGLTSFLVLEECKRLSRKESDASQRSTDPPTHPKPKSDPSVPLSLARKICGDPPRRNMLAFKHGKGWVRVTCDIEENEPFLEVAERDEKGGITSCLDADLDDHADACGSTEREEEALRMTAPPRGDFDKWFHNNLASANQLKR